MRLKSPDPLAPPEIRFNFLRSDYDMQAMIAGIRIARKIAGQPALQKLVVEEVLPGPAVTTDEQLADEVRLRGVSNLHPVGECSMGHGPNAWSIRGCGCTVSKGCAWSMPRSCRRSSPATPTHQPS